MVTPMRRLFLALALSLVCAAHAQRPAQVASFRDGEFRDSDWRLSVLSNHPFASARVEQRPSGGSPGPYRRVYHIPANAQLLALGDEINAG
jgi:hypothetical protein